MLQTSTLAGCGYGATVVLCLHRTQTLGKGISIIKRILLSLVAAIGTELLALVLGVTALNPGTVTGPSLVALSIGPAMLFPALICIWSKRAVSGIRKHAIWAGASIFGILVYLAVEQLGGILLLSGQAGLGLSLGVFSGLPAMLASSVVAVVALRRARIDRTAMEESP